MLMALGPGCSCGTTGDHHVGNTTGKASGSGGNGGSGGQGGGSTGTAGGGTGGSAGGAVAYGPAASDLVNAGGVASSPGYKMVFTLGQSTQIQATSTSPSYRMQGGLVGANGDLK